MNKTNYMRADDIANGFNGVEDRKYWRATIAGTRVNPEINFNSRASMVTVTYRVTSNDFTVSFSRASAAFGDFLASAHRAMGQVLASLKAAGLPFPCAVDEKAVLRVEYNARTKAATVHIAGHGDDWPSAEPLPFKVPARNNTEIEVKEVDAA